MQIVWLKRDLRLSDHEPLKQALALASTAAAGPVLVCYLHEPSLLAHGDWAAQHLGFVQESLQAIDDELQQRGSALLCLTLDAVPALDAIRTALTTASPQTPCLQPHKLTRHTAAPAEPEHCTASSATPPAPASTQGLTHLWAHRETTHRLGFERDREVRRWARHWAQKEGLVFSELPQNAVLRGSERHTQSFDFSAHVQASATNAPWTLPYPERRRTKRAAERSAEPSGAPCTSSSDSYGSYHSTALGLMPAKAVKKLRAAVLKLAPHAAQDPLACLVHPALPGWLQDGTQPQRGPLEDKVLRLSGGRAAALEQLERFLRTDNLLAYPSAISSPLSALDHCSRLSPYLAWGVLSDREVLRALTAKLDMESDWVDADVRERLLSAARFYVERLYWRSAYLQGAENTPDLKERAGLATFGALREAERRDGWLQAWAAGKPGFPFVDAAMRMLNATGWLNMRLRGTVTSFAVNDLWLPWQEVGLVLAREFLDYEPAIHWSQMQIHAGVAARSEPLTYDAVKQARDHDPKGVFVRQWVPELREVPLQWLFEPWKMPPAVQQACGVLLGQDYPLPLVRYPAANDAARQRVAALRLGQEPPASLYWKERNKDLAKQGQQSLF